MSVKILNPVTPLEKHYRMIDNLVRFQFEKKSAKKIVANLAHKGLIKDLKITKDKRNLDISLSFQNTTRGINWKIRLMKDGRLFLKTRKATNGGPREDFSTPSQILPQQNGVPDSISYIPNFIKVMSGII